MIYAINWLDTYVDIDGINTYAMYSNIIYKHIIPELGHIQVSKLKTSDIVLMMSQKKQHPRTCEQILMTLKRIYKSAISDDIILSTDFDKIFNGAKDPDYTPPKKRALTDLEKKALKICVSNTTIFTKRELIFVMVIFYFGLRREEAIALMINDFDFNQNMLHIQRAIVFKCNSPIIKDTKSFAGDRYIPIPIEAKSQIKALLKASESPYIITCKNGLMTKSSYDKMWSSIVKKMNNSIQTKAEAKMNICPINVTAHIFRHNYCTMLYYSGISQLKAIELMGHSDSKMIMEIYAHLDEQKEKAGTKINNSIKIG